MSSDSGMPPPKMPLPEPAPPADGEAFSLEPNNSLTTQKTNVASTSSTPASSITGGPTSRLRTPTNYSGDASANVAKFGRLCSHAAPKAGPPPRDTKSMSRESDDNLSSCNSTFTDHGAVLTQDTEQFIIGQKVWVGGIRPGQIAYIGETHFAPGDWAGIVLDEPNGKNDGCVAGKRYFQCEPKRGIFSRLTRLTLTPFSGANTPTSPLAKMSPDRSRTVSPTASIRSSFQRSPGKNGLTVGDRVIVSSGFGSRPGILRYLGETQFASGNWCGIELDEPSGKNDGSVDGVKYFECKPKYGVFVPIAKVSLSPSSKKSRLSRAGSRESLNSIGTMNSIATTNTSRLRMNAQRKSLSIKPLGTTPKSQYSMQDLLHEKQKHIEQLIIERELDREDCQNQALQYQKNINELKSRIVQLERSLDDERKKSEDLQFSIDEATYCGNDVQTNVYKEKIQELEKKVSSLSTETSSTLKTEPSTEDISAAVTAATEVATARIAELVLQLQQQKDEYEERLATTEDEQKRFQEKVEYLRKENETMRKELMDKDESLEKFSLSACGIKNLREELDLLKEEAERERQQLQAEFDRKMEEKDLLVDSLRSGLDIEKTTLAALEVERSNMRGECDILKTECKSRDEQLQDLNEQLSKLKAEFSIQKAENATLDELLKVQEAGALQEKIQVEESLLEIEKLRKEVESLQKAKEHSDSQFKAAKEEVKQLGELQKALDEKMNVAKEKDKESFEAVTKMGMIMEELKKQNSSITIENENLKIEIKKINELKAHADSTEAELRKLLNDQQQVYTANVEKLEEANSSLQKRLECDQQNYQEGLSKKQIENASLNVQVGQLQKQFNSLELDSSAKIQKLSSKISDIELKSQLLQDDLKSKENALKSEMEAFSHQERILTDKTESLNSAITALETTTNLSNRLKQELDLLATKYSDIENTNRIQAEQCAQQQLEIGDLTRKLDNVTLKCDSLNIQNEALENDLKSSRSITCKLEEEVHRLKEEITVRQNNLLEVESKNNNDRLKLESELEEISQKLTHAFKDLTEAQANNEHIRNELEKKNGQLTALEEKTIKLELKLSDEQRKQENLQSKYESLIVQNRTLEEDLKNFRTTSTDSNAELLKMSQTVSAKQKAYDELLDKMNTERTVLEGQLQASKQRIDMLCNQVEMLTQENKGATEENFKQLELLKQAQEKNGKLELELSESTRKCEVMSAKCKGVENENVNLHKDLIALRNASATSSATVAKLTEELTQRQKIIQDFTDKSNSERLQFDNQLQELEQRFQTSILDIEQLRSELQATIESKNSQAKEFESLKLEMQAKLSDQLHNLKERETVEQKKIIENFETQLKCAELTKNRLDEAISSLQQQIKLLQDELLKSQLNFKCKEEELGKQITILVNEAETLRDALRHAETSGANSFSIIQIEKQELQSKVDSLQAELKAKEDQLLLNLAETEKLKQSESAGLVDSTKLQEEIISLKTALDLANTEVEFRTKMADADKAKLEELRNLLDTVQEVNANISATNANLSEALHILEQEKCETANIFELFEMESDQNMEKLSEKLIDLKQQLVDARTDIEQKSKIITEKQSDLEEVLAKLEASEGALASAQATLLEQNLKIDELKSVKTETEKLISERNDVLQQHADMQRKLEEYKQVIDEMDKESNAKSDNLEQLKERIKALEKENSLNLESQNVLRTDNISLQRKLEILGLEKTQEIVAAQSRINDLQAINMLKQSKSAVGGEPAEGDETENSTAQINFLNSIIADMQKKNDQLKAKINALEALPTDYTQPKAFEIIAKRKPAPRVFCDICDEFDKHETEDCPLQASDARDYSPPPPKDPADKKVRKLPEPRKYCETCEVFGHETGECEDDEW
ncbi:restin homolog isoform X4 [Ceratitis capitata]|uniref:restin homolog isoform X4 n=2 Tax=Ceratitis capitata TaxID=7213 RepID=UPI000329F74C|nr:restin homolog isoform X4 [Ceratitis capitata]